MLQALVESAFEYAYPLYAIANTRYRAVQAPLNPARHVPNTLQHLRQLNDPRSRWITAPNNVTLYSNAWIDLSAGPVRVCVGAQPAGRCWSVAVTLAGHGQPAAGLRGRVIPVPGHDVGLSARCLVDGEHDLVHAHAHAMPV